VTAFAQLAFPQDYELWLAGPSDRRYTPKLLAQARDLGVEQQVKCLDYVAYAQLPILLNQALGLVFPSLWEGFGFPVLEAMACGTPVITSHLSSLPEVTGDAALLVNPYEVSELAQAMQQLCDDPALRSQLKQRGLERAKSFSWQKTGQATVEVLRQLS
jgi:glycosyltransferase involved in cell wall biosynthesis